MKLSTNTLVLNLIFALFGKMPPRQLGYLRNNFYVINQVNCLHEYIRDGKRGSFLSLAVSTRTLKGPLGQRTATRSGKKRLQDNKYESHHP